jgi:hypothetical protein
MKQDHRNLLAFMAILVFAGSVYLLATGSPVLLLEAFGLSELPLGTLITWAGFVSLPVATILAFHQFLSQESRLSKAANSVMMVMLTLCGSWGFVGFGLAGNWAFNFSNRSDSFQGSVSAARAFWIYSVSTVAITLVTSIAILTFELFSNRRKD